MYIVFASSHQNQAAWNAQQDHLVTSHSEMKRQVTRNTRVGRHFYRDLF